jgi:hypothetical protein
MEVHMLYEVPDMGFEGSDWEDFLIAEPGGRSATFEVGDVPDGKKFTHRLNLDGWYDVTVRKLTKEIVREVLAELHGMQPDDIVLKQYSDLIIADPN